MAPGQQEAAWNNIITKSGVYKPTRQELTGIRNLLMSQIDQVPHPDSEDMLQTFREYISPEDLFGHAALSGPTTLHRFVRDLFVLLGVPYQRYGNKRIIWGLAAQIFPKEEELNHCY